MPSNQSSSSNTFPNFDPFLTTGNGNQESGTSRSIIQEYIRAPSLPAGTGSRMAFNQPSSSNSAADTTFIVFDEDYVSELRARLIDSVSRFGTINPLSMMSLLEAERQIAESKNQSSEAGSHDSGSGSLTAQPVQAPDQDYFYDKYLTASVRKQMAKRLNMTDQEILHCPSHKSFHRYSTCPK
ncbi:hypothetical protein L3Y34_002472 [Caenorhabditis briggsae]|uniref:Uncharacterized protein n=1 Tax=Caenorhabditis briggsae TaxID=6238 RepID=A0AAE9DG30_CAEBR|nr:hypothetical protein L3Y34_002472 [Caenorhabditis briggsae]